MKKALLLNGSPRSNGNTAAALAAVAAGLAKKYSVETVAVCELKLRGCIACDGCKRNDGDCVLPDGGREFMNKVAAADLIVFGSPVYWWGISAQLKAALDKFYSKDEAFHQIKKKIAVISVGGATLDDPEFELISRQFHCIAEFLGWEVVLDRSFSAYGVGDLAARTEELNALRREAENI